MTTFFTAETHFNDPEVITYEHLGKRIRPWDTVEEQNQIIIDNWNSRVQPEDTVYHMGDVYDTNTANSAELIDKLNGRKILIRGDKDMDPVEKYLEHFDQVHNPPYVVEINGSRYVLSHFYISKDQLDQLDCSVNIHSHLHADSLPDPRYFSVSLERTDFYPLSSEELVEEIKKHQIETIKTVKF